MNRLPGAQNCPGCLARYPGGAVVQVCAVCGVSAVWCGRCGLYHKRTPDTDREAGLEPAPAPVRVRCAHDGAYCHHQCRPGACWRARGGAELSTPYTGYPAIGSALERWDQTWGRGRG